MLKEIEKQTGTTNEQKIINYFRNNKNPISNLDKIDLSIRQKQTQLELNMQQVIFLTQEIMSLQAEKETQQEAISIRKAKLDQIPSYPELRDLWEHNMVRWIGKKSDKNLLEIWKRVLEVFMSSDIISPETTFEAINEDYKAHPDEYTEQEPYDLN